MRIYADTLRWQYFPNNFSNFRVRLIKRFKTNKNKQKSK